MNDEIILAKLLVGVELESELEMILDAYDMVITREEMIYGSLIDNIASM